MQINSDVIRFKSGLQFIQKSQIWRVPFLYIFAHFILMLQLNKMIQNYKLTKVCIWSVLTMVFMFTYTNLKAQDWGDWGNDEATEDSTELDSTTQEDSGFGWGDGFGEEESKDDKGTPPKPLVKYERLDIIPVDTLTKLITYTAVHDVENSCEYCTSDSLYFRAKKYLLTKFGDGKKFPKKWIIEDLVNQRILLNVRLPLWIEPNASSKKQEGEYEYKFQLWIRDFAYKYKFTHIVHQDPVVAGKPGTFTPVYLEYYLKNKTKVRFTDMILSAIDRDMKELIADIVKIMKDPVTVDLDEEDF